MKSGYRYYKRHLLLHNYKSGYQAGESTIAGTLNTYFQIQHSLPLRLGGPIYSILKIYTSSLNNSSNLR